MKGGAHPSPFAALAFPNSKKVPIYYWVDNESFPIVAASNSRPYGDFLHHDRAAQITRPQHLSYLQICQTVQISCDVLTILSCPTSFLHNCNIYTFWLQTNRVIIFKVWCHFCYTVLKQKSKFEVLLVSKKLMI